ncbi:MAG: small basic protein [Candidatus Omnitrophica bacterium]|nr:small basic protein [Candidatus Omnitrophota bacterium]
MTQHPSLRSDSKTKKHRSVLKRFERLKHLKEKGEWEDETSIFGLPKLKIIKFKIKKEKAAPEEAVAAAEGAEGQAQEAVGGAQPKGKEGAAAKGAPQAGAKKDEKGQAKGAPSKK